MLTVELRDDLQAAWGDADPFAAAFALQGKAVREVAERSTVRTQIDGRWYYAKRHYGVGWREIIKNWLFLRRPIVDASNEYRAVQLLQKIGVGTLNVAGYGARGSNPAKRESFLVTDELTPVLSLEQYALRWIEEPPDPELKRGLIRRVADMARRVHTAGLNHRDFYICHFLLLHPEQLDRVSVAKHPIHLVDLHRAQIRPQVPYRWLVKDLGSLAYSAMEIGLTRRDTLRFLALYFDQPWRQVLQDESKLLADVQRRAERLYGEAQRKRILPRQLAGIT